MIFFLLIYSKFRSPHCNLTLKLSHPHCHLCWTNMLHSKHFMFIQDSKAIHHSWHLIWEGQTFKAGNDLPKIWAVLWFSKIQKAVNNIVVHKLIFDFRRSYHRSLMLARKDYPHKLWSTLNSLLSRNMPSCLPSFSSASTLAASSLKKLMTKFHFCVQNFHHQQFR